MTNCARLAAVVSAGLSAALHVSPHASSQPGKDVTPVVTAINRSGLDLLRLSGSGTDHNVVLSPYSIGEAMAMVYSGADGQTRVEMRRALHLPATETVLFAGLGDLRAQFDLLVKRSQDDARRAAARGDSQPPTELLVANRIFAQRGFALRSTYAARLRDALAAPPEELDFSGAPEAGRRAINSSISRQTRDRIREMLPPGAIAADTRLVLANAVYLKARWAQAFPKEATAAEPFWVKGRDSADVPMMLQQRRLPYARHPGFTALALPYEGSHLQFLILLPDERGGLAALERDTTAALLAGCATMPEQLVRLRLPRLELEPPSRPLGEQLRALGMMTAFDRPPGSADFDRMAPRRPDAYLYLSEVYHQAWLSLDEIGTEATAATVALMGLAGSAMPRREPEPIEVRVDRPFLFAIQHVQSGATLFLGRVTDPR